MVDRLRRSLEELEPPVCAQCELEMKWYRSEIQRAELDLVDHHFFCVSCGNVSVQATALHKKSPSDDSGRLSLPFAGAMDRAVTRLRMPEHHVSNLR